AAPAPVPRSAGARCRATLRPEERPEQVHCARLVLLRATSRERRRGEGTEGSRDRVRQARLSSIVAVLVLIRQGRLRSAGRPFRGVAADLGLQGHQVDEMVCLTAQIVRNHRGLRGHGRDDGHLAPPSLKGFDESAEVAVTRENHVVVDNVSKYCRVHGQFNAYVALYLATTG